MDLQWFKVNLHQRNGKTFCRFRSAFELEALQESLTEIREGLHPDNAAKFTDNVEVHMQHIQTGVSQLGNLQAFMMRPKVELKQEPL